MEDWEAGCLHRFCKVWVPSLRPSAQAPLHGLLCCFCQGPSNLGRSREKLAVSLPTLRQNQAPGKREAHQSLGDGGERSELLTALFLGGSLLCSPFLANIPSLGTL